MKHYIHEKKSVVVSYEAIESVIARLKQSGRIPLIGFMEVEKLGIVKLSYWKPTQEDAQ